MYERAESIPEKRLGHFLVDALESPFMRLFWLIIAKKSESQAEGTKGRETAGRRDRRRRHGGEDRHGRDRGANQAEERERRRRAGEQGRQGAGGRAVANGASRRLRCDARPRMRALVDRDELVHLDLGVALRRRQRSAPARAGAAARNMTRTKFVHMFQSSSGWPNGPATTLPPTGKEAPPKRGHRSTQIARTV